MRHIAKYEDILGSRTEDNSMNKLSSKQWQEKLKICKLYPLRI